MQTNRNLYDAYVNDSDLIGTHSRLQGATNLTDWMAGEGRTSPCRRSTSTTSSANPSPPGRTASCGSCPTSNSPISTGSAGLVRPPGSQGQVQGQIRTAGVPVNWSAWDIADFFTNDVKEIDGVRVYAIWITAARSDLGWRMTDAWLSMAGEGSKGLPNGRPIDEWGIRMEEGSCNPAGASVSRGGGTSSPAASMPSPNGTSGCAICTAGCRRPRLLPVAAGLGARQCRPADLLVHRLHPDHGEAEERGNNTADENGTPLCCAWPSPHGPYWVEGMSSAIRMPAPGRCSTPPRRPSQGGGSMPSSPCRSRCR